jgi:hypothetical protein
MYLTSYGHTIVITVRLAGFDSDEYRHWYSPLPCMVSLKVAGSMHFASSWELLPVPVVRSGDSQSKELDNFSKGQLISITTMNHPSLSGIWSYLPTVLLFA